MIIHVANPIYDSVFKYIMEDERIAKTILSALLKKEVIHVMVRPHEYSNTTRDTLSMFRIDFAATVREREDDAVKDRTVLIELQKTWLNTETLRFRQYLGAQYSNKKNMRNADGKGFAYPMVAVYLLGHKVGDIKEPIVYVNHDVFDYNGNIVADGNEEPFVESLTHDSIIVQIPLLHGNVNNRLEKVLSVFDQTLVDGNTLQVLKIDEDRYADDSDMMYVLHKLTAAAANSELRQDMNVEDEYYKGGLFSADHKPKTYLRSNGHLGFVIYFRSSITFSKQMPVIAEICFSVIPLSNKALAILRSCSSFCDNCSLCCDNCSLCCDNCSLCCDNCCSCSLSILSRCIIAVSRSSMAL